MTPPPDWRRRLIVAALWLLAGTIGCTAALVSVDAGAPDLVSGGFLAAAFLSWLASRLCLNQIAKLSRRR